MREYLLQQTSEKIFLREPFKAEFIFARAIRAIRAQEHDHFIWGTNSGVLTTEHNTDSLSSTAASPKTKKV
uniref:Uncharacterized protein n=1 Tax=Romanomermis culicivorax TaxID=13658 RepID=A0A915LAJ5_ROMCU